MRSHITVNNEKEQQKQLKTNQKEKLQKVHMKCEGQM